MPTVVKEAFEQWFSGLALLIPMNCLSEADSFVVLPVVPILEIPSEFILLFPCLRPSVAFLICCSIAILVFPVLSSLFCS